MTSQSADVGAIRDLAEAWRCGWEAGDVEAILALYADEPVLMPQDQPAVFGKEAIRALYDPVLRAFAFRSESTVVEIEVDGDLGYIWSSYDLAATPTAGGESIRSAGKSLFIVKRRADGPWRIARLIDNSDGPPADQP